MTFEVIMYAWRVLILLWGCVFSFCCAAFGDPAVAPVMNSLEINLKSAVRLNAERIFLDEVLQNCSGDVAVCDEIKGIDLGEAPAPGKTATLTPMRIVTTLKEIYPTLAVRVGGASAVALSSEVQEISVQDLQQEIERRLADINEELSGYKVSLNKLYTTQNLKVRPGEWEMTFPELDNMENWTERFFLAGARSAFSLTLHIVNSEGEAVHKFQVRLRWDVYRDAFVFKDNFAAGHTLADADMERRSLKVSGFAADSTAMGSIKAGLVLRSNVRAGQEVKPGLFRVQGFIRRGNLVNLLMKNGTMHINGKGKALGEGGLGDQIEVEYLKTKKRLRGKIVSPELIEVVF